jgi:hypothetical protein
MLIFKKQKHSNQYRFLIMSLAGPALKIKLSSSNGFKNKEIRIKSKLKCMLLITFTFPVGLSQKLSLNCRIKLIKFKIYY